MKKLDYQKRGQVQLGCLFFVFILSLFASNSLYAQWGFNTTLIYSGKCYDSGSLLSISFPISGFRTKKECELARSMIMSISANAGGCRVSYRCTTCTGNDVAALKEMPLGTLEINGVANGRAYFSPNQAQSIKNWMDDVQLKFQAFGDNTMSNVLIPSVGDKEFDKTYQDEVVAYIGKSRVPISVDPNKLKVKTNDSPPLPTIDMDKRMKIARAMSEINMKLEELYQIERFKDFFCNKRSDKCEFYQDKWEEVRDELNEKKAEYVKLKEEEYISELEKYQMELEKCEQEQVGLNEFWGGQIQKQIDVLNEQIEMITAKLENIDQEILSKEQAVKEQSLQISWADKTEEIANERLRIIGEERDKLYNNLLKGEISDAKFKNLNEALNIQENAIMNDIILAKAARKTTDIYEYVKENKDVVKTIAIDVSEFIAHTGVNVATIAMLPETAGMSLALATMAHLEISTLAEMVRGKDFFNSAQGAVQGSIEDAVINKIIPIKIIAGGSKVKITYENANEHVTKKIGGKEISFSEIWRPFSKAWNSPE